MAAGVHRLVASSSPLLLLLLLAPVAVAPARPSPSAAPVSKPPAAGTAALAQPSGGDVGSVSGVLDTGDEVESAQVEKAAACGSRCRATSSWGQEEDVGALVPLQNALLPSVPMSALLPCGAPLAAAGTACGRVMWGSGWWRSGCGWCRGCGSCSTEGVSCTDGEKGPRLITASGTLGWKAWPALLLLFSLALPACSSWCWCWWRDAGASWGE